MTEEIARKHTSITHDSEKVILDSLALKVYKIFNADALSIIGYLGNLFSAICFILAGKNMVFLLLAPLGIFINWFGDSLDGRVAGLRKEYRPKTGYYIDKFIDALSYITIALGMDYSSLTLKPYWLYGLIIALLTLIHFFLKAEIRRVLDLNMGVIGPTEVRIITIIFIILFFLTKNPLYFNKIIGYYTLLDLFGLIFCIILSISLSISVFNTIWGKDKIKEY